MRSILVLSVLLSLGGTVRAQPAALTRIGAAAAVRGSVSALAPTAGAVGRVMSSGKEVYLRDKVTTNAQGRMQVMLLDETVFTIGPNSAMVLDEFVYDPNSGAGKVTARVTKGVFRFVTGRVAKDQPANMKVKLPVGTIGIRGTIAGGQVSETKSLVVLMGPGEKNNVGANAGSISVSNAGQEVELSKTGFGTVVEPGKAPTPPFEVPPSVMAELSGGLSAKPGESSKDSGGGESSSVPPGESAGESAGQETAAAAAPAAATTENAATTEALALVTQNASLDNTANASSADAILNGNATWNNVRTLNSGTGDYFTSGVFTRTKILGSPCSSGCSGSWNFSVTVNYAARTISGSSSFSQTSTPSISDSASDIALDIGGNYSSLSGNASFTHTHTNTLWTFQFLNAGGTAAKQLQGDVSYSDASGNAGVGATLVGTVSLD